MNKNKINFNKFKLSLVFLLSSITAISIAMDDSSVAQLINNGEVLALNVASIPVDNPSESINKGRIKELYESVQSKFGTTKEWVWQNILKPYPMVGDYSDNDYAQQNRTRRDVRERADFAVQCAEASDANRTDKAKAYLLNMYASLLDFPMNHGIIGNTFWYSGLASIAAGAGYGFYKLYRSIRPANVEGPFDIYRTIAKQAKEYALEDSQLVDESFSLDSQVFSDHEKLALNAGWAVLQNDYVADYELLMSSVVAFEEALKQKNISLMNETYKKLNIQINIANKLFHKSLKKIMKEVQELSQQINANNVSF